MASDSSGNFVVVWQSYTQDGSGYGVFGQRFAPAPERPRARVPRQHLHDERPESPGGGLGHRRRLRRRLAERRPGRLRLRRLRPALRQHRCAAWSRVPASTRTRRVPRARPDVAADASGRLRRRLAELYQDGAGYGIFGQRCCSSTGVPGPEFRVNTYTASTQRGPAVAADAAGNFVVVWQSYGRTAQATASSASATPAPVRTSVPSSASTRTRRNASSRQQWPRTPPATSSSSGRVSTRTATSYGVFGQRYSAIAPVERTRFEVE